MDKILSPIAAIEACKRAIAEGEAIVAQARADYHLDEPNSSVGQAWRQKASARLDLDLTDEDDWLLCRAVFVMLALARRTTKAGLRAACDLDVAKHLTDIGIVPELAEELARTAAKAAAAVDPRRPWDKADISRRTWYRHRATERGTRSATEAPETPLKAPRSRQKRKRWQVLGPDNGSTECRPYVESSDGLKNSELRFNAATHQTFDALMAAKDYALRAPDTRPEELTKARLAEVHRVVTEWNRLEEELRQKRRAA
jgi:hypothetical protein